MCDDHEFDTFKPNLSDLPLDDLLDLAEAEGVNSEALQTLVAHRMEQRRLLKEKEKIVIRLEEIEDETARQQSALVDDVEIHRDEHEFPDEDELSDAEGDEDGP